MWRRTAAPGQPNLIEKRGELLSLGPPPWLEAVALELSSMRLAGGGCGAAADDEGRPMESSSGGEHARRHGPRTWSWEEAVCKPPRCSTHTGSGWQPCGGAVSWRFGWAPTRVAGRGRWLPAWIPATTVETEKGKEEGQLSVAGGGGGGGVAWI